MALAAAVVLARLALARPLGLPSTRAIPWLLAAALSLLLVSTRSWIPRRLLLAAGWFATGVVAMIGPAACWVLIPVLVRGGDPKGGIAIWAFAATRSYQLRSADLRMSSPT